MDKVYYNSARTEILKKLSFLRDRNFVDFFEESLPFTLAINLAYFGLAEDVIITRDNDDINIATRFTRNVSQDDLANLFPVGHGIEISKKEQNGNSREWFLSTLRNGIFHNGLTVDYGKRKVKVENDGFLNELECSVPFEWFKEFMESNIVYGLLLDKYEYNLFFTQCNGREKKLVTGEDIDDFIENELIGYTVRFNRNENVSGDRISRSDFIDFSNNSTQLFINLFNGYGESDELNELNLIKNTVGNELGSLPNKTRSEYEKLVFSKTFEAWYIDRFKKKYPNYDISLEKFNNKKYSSRIFRRYKEKKKFLEEKYPINQRRFIAKRLGNITNYDKVDYLEKIQNLKFLYDDCLRLMSDDYEFDNNLKSVLSKQKTNSHNIEQIFIERCYKRMEESDILESYDEQITISVLNDMEFSHDDIHKRCWELNDSYKGQHFTEEHFDFVKNGLKSEFPDYYTEKAIEFKEEGYLPDYIEKQFNSFNKDRLALFLRAKGTLIKNMDDVIEALLYTLGINTYVMNKENVFKDFGDNDYSFMDGLNISGYSKDSYTNLCDVRSKKRKHVKSFNGINKNIGNLDNALASISDPNRKSELTLLRNQRAAEASIEQAEIIRCDNYINSIDELEYDGVRLASLDNNQCATTIRNCFAHCDRIHVDGRDKNGEVFLTLTDYDENGNLSGIVKTDLTSIIRFLSHDTFYKEVNKEVVAEDTSVNVLVEPPIIETEEVVNSKGSKK